MKKKSWKTSNNVQTQWIFALKPNQISNTYNWQPSFPSFPKLTFALFIWRKDQLTTRPCYLCHNLFHYQMRSRSWVRYKWNTYNDADGGIFNLCFWQHKWRSSKSIVFLITQYSGTRLFKILYLLYGGDSLYFDITEKRGAGSIISASGRIRLFLKRMEQSLF